MTVPYTGPTPPFHGGGAAPPPPPPGVDGSAPYGLGSSGPRPGAGALIGDAFGFAWRGYWSNWGAALLAILAWLALGAGVLLAWRLALGVLGLPFLATDPAVPLVLHGDGSLLAEVVENLAGGVFGYVVHAGMIAGALRITAGGRVTAGSFFAIERFGTVLVVALLLAPVSQIGYAWAFVPGVVVDFFALFALFFVLDRGEGVIQALASSIRLVARNLGPVALLYLAAIAAVLAGAMACGVGLLVAGPLAVIAQACVYRRLVEPDAG